MQDAALAIVIDTNNSILLVKRKDVPVWVIPGGGIDPLESPEKAAVRETKEETGVDVTISKHIATYTPINRLASTTYLFLCTPEKEVAITHQQEEVAEARFFPINSLPLKLFFLHKTFIEEWQEASLFPISRELSEITYTALFLHFLRHPFLVLRHLKTRLTKR